MFTSMTIPCKTPPLAAIAAGAVTTYSFPGFGRLDQTFGMLPPAVHHLLAGFVMEYIKGLQEGSMQVPFNQGGVCAALWAYFGAHVTGSVTGNGPFVREIPLVGRVINY